MKQDTVCNIINTLYYLYFKNAEFIHYFERVWTANGMSFTDKEYCYVFCGIGYTNFPVSLETYYFLYDNDFFEKTGGNEHECSYQLADDIRIKLTTVLKEKNKVNSLKNLAL